jgi:hypothetical protein
MGEGLRYSRHPEGRGEGHSTAVNLTPMKTGQGHPDRITFFRNLFTTSDERMPRVIGASCVDLINNLIYNWGTHAASGNPRSLNLIGNWFRKGPRMSKPYTWWPTTAGDAPHFFRRSVFTPMPAAVPRTTRSTPTAPAAVARRFGLARSAPSWPRC